MNGTGTQISARSQPHHRQRKHVHRQYHDQRRHDLAPPPAVFGNIGPFGREPTRAHHVNAGGTLQFDAPNIFAEGYYGSFNVPTLNINGGVVTNGDPAATGKVNNALNNVNLTMAR